MGTGTYQYKDSFVVIRYMLGEARAYTRPQKCICCGKALNDKECVALLINNYKYFPNILVHKKCLEALENDAESEVKMENLFQKIEQMYQQYRELKVYLG